MRTDTKRRRAAGWGPTVLLAAGLLAGACGGDDGGTGVAAADPGKAGERNTAAAGGGTDPVAYSRCMRENGVPNFPDPGPDGSLKIDGSKVRMDSPAFAAAQDKCEKYDAAPPPEAPADRKAALAYAKCMRENGVPDFPDPNPDGGTDIDGGKIDLDSPVFKKADDTCKKHLANGGKPKNTA